jgi:hypothetical protein
MPAGLMAGVTSVIVRIADSSEKLRHFRDGPEAAIGKVSGATPFCDPAPYSAERFTR